jgi:hypothetical protein
LVKIFTHSCTGLYDVRNILVSQVQQIGL